MYRWCMSVALLTSAVPALAQELPGDVDAGRGLAQKSCSKCHSVSAAERRTRAYDAPGFDEIAAKLQTTAISLRAFLQQPHPNMPDLILSPDERDDAIVYILSLKQRSY